MAAESGAERGRALEALLEMGFGARAKALALTGNRGVEPAMDWGSGGIWGVSGRELGGPGEEFRASEKDFGECLAAPPGIWGFGRDSGVSRRDFGVLSPIRGSPRLLTEAGQERERRRRGQELTKLREWRRDEERRRAAEERRRDRAEERAARIPPSPIFPPQFAPVSPSPAPVTPQEPPAPREYDQCRIQVRLPDGRALAQSFRAREPLAAVRLFVELHRDTGSTGSAGNGTGSPPEPFSLRTAFPRRLFTEEDMEKPLQELGLVPSAVVIVAKKEGS
uniref:UBX domain protein 1 n=1 Tax=Catharus ustulatus TaxID=91951 RepID=A0A8C3U6C7_CATUS